MANGELKPIKDIKIESVITHLNKVKLVIDKFSTKHNKIYKIKFNGKEIKCSTNHKFLVKRNNKFIYVQADSLL